jgi:hypothetical protein
MEFVICLLPYASLGSPAVARAELRIVIKTVKATAERFRNMGEISFRKVGFGGPP